MRLFLLGLIVLLSLTRIKAGQRREYTLTFEYAPNSTSIVLINGLFPGPLLEADLNDIFVVHVLNRLPEHEEVTLHFHGLFARETPQMDGVAYVTQMPIPSHHNFTYVMLAYPSGTYFYHSHSGLHSITAFGGVLVRDNRDFGNVIEIPGGPLFFSDQWEQPDRLTQEEGLMKSPFKWMGEPNTLLINGQRNYQMILQPNKKYLFRFIGATSLSTIVFGIDEHSMTVVEVDGTAVKPKSKVNALEIMSGQRYAVIVRTKQQDTGVFLMKGEIRWRTTSINATCFALIRYGPSSKAPFDINSLAHPRLPHETELMAFSWREPYESFNDDERMPNGKANRQYLIITSQQHTPDGLGIRWLMNNASLDMYQLMHLTKPLLFDLYDGNQEKLPKSVTYELNENETIDIVLQNTVALDGKCESHPFHMHGHKFWIHSHGPGLYDDDLTQNAFEIINPILRDSVLLYPSHFAYFHSNRSRLNHYKPCGWTKVRVIGDNPGLWLLHCHIGAHALMGMNLLIKESIDKLVMRYLV